MFLNQYKLRSKALNLINNFNLIKLAWFYLIIPNFILSLKLTNNDPKYIFLTILLLIFLLRFLKKNLLKAFIRLKRKIRAIITALIMTIFISYIIGGLGII